MAKNNHITAHDYFIRHIMSKPIVAAEFFENNLPEQIKAVVDLNTIKPQPESFIDDNLKLQITDLLYSVQFNKQPGYLYLLVEHLSTPQRITPFRLLKYMLAIMQRHVDQTGKDELPLIYPMIIYAGKKKYNYSTNLFDLFGDNKDLAKEILFQPYQLVDLTKIPDNELERHIWYGTMALLMKHIFDKNIILFFNDIIKQLKTIENIGDNDYIYTALSYVVQSNEITDRKKFQEIIRTGLSEKSEEIYMPSLAAQWKQEGRQEGWQAGIQKGLLEGKLEGKLEGLLEGKHEIAITIAKNLLHQGMPIEQIALVTGLTLSQVKELQKL